jgi:phosphoglycolate phosphatase
VGGVFHGQRREMTFKAALFDLDGTLLDSLVDIADSMNIVLAEMGFPGHPAESYRIFVGDGVPPLVSRALPAESRDDPRLIEEGGRRLKEVYAQRWHRQTRPYEGVSRLLTLLEGKGIPMSVFSNKPDEFTQIMVEKLLPRGAFRCVLGIKPGMRRKPDPAGALAAARAMGVQAAETAYLGDTKTDMQTAAKAGMYAVGALWGFRTREELERNGARRVIASPMEFLDFF